MEEREVIDIYLGSGRCISTCISPPYLANKSLMLIIIHTESEGDVAGVFETHETSLLEQHQRNKLHDLSVTIMYKVLYVGVFSQVLKENGDLSVQNRPLSSFLASVIPVKTHATSSGNS